MNVARFITKRLSDYKKSPITALFIRIAFFSVVLSVLVMILSSFLITGFKSEIENKMSLLFGDLEISIGVNNTSNFGQKEYFKMPDNRLDSISKEPGIKAVEALSISPAMIKKDAAPLGVLFLCRKDYLSKPKENLLVEGRMPQTHKENNIYEVTISKNIAAKLDAKLGNELICYANSSAQEKILTRKIKVVGIYNSSIYENDDAVVWLNMDYAREVTGIAEDEYNKVELILEDREKAKEISNNIWDKYLSNPLNISSLPDRYGYITDWLELQKTNERIILIIMFFIALISMISCVLILILDKLSLIGTLKSLGAQNRTIQQVFLILSQKIILRGLLWGNIIALLITFLQRRFHFMRLPEKYYMLNFVPLDFDIAKLVTINLNFFLFISIALLIPTLIIRRMSAVEILRYK